MNDYINNLIEPNLTATETRQLIILSFEWLTRQRWKQYINNEIRVDIEKHFVENLDMTSNKAIDLSNIDRTFWNELQMLKKTVKLLYYHSEYKEVAGELKHYRFVNKQSENIFSKDSKISKFLFLANL